MRTCMHVCVRHARLRCQCMYMKFVCVRACVHEVYVHAFMCLHVSQSMRGASWVVTQRHGRAGRLVRKTSTYLHDLGQDKVV